MATVIERENKTNHNIEKYTFKLLSSHPSEDIKIEERQYTEENNPNRRSSDLSTVGVDSSAITTSSKEALIESLMQKTEEMSTNFVKLQMNLETKEEEHKLALQKMKEEAFAQGLEEGIQKSQTETQENIKRGIEQFSSSVSSLELSAKEFEIALENIKADLILAALDIAKEVVDVELSENSNDIAKVLSEGLIKELQGASKITLKINPKNHGEISTHLGELDNVQLVSDSAISEGGVIAMSDAGNIDSQISKRFEKVKRAVSSE